MKEYRYLLDTNIVSDMVRNPAGTVARRLAKVGDSLVCTSIIVVCELRFGAEKSASQRLLWQLEQVLSPLAALPLEGNVPYHYATIRAHLERAGTPIGPNDMLIAAQSLDLGLTVVTDNVREFCRVPGLNVENWLENTA